MVINNYFTSMMKLGESIAILMSFIIIKDLMFSKNDNKGPTCILQSCRTTLTIYQNEFYCTD